MCEGLACGDSSAFSSPRGRVPGHILLCLGPDVEAAGMSFAHSRDRDFSRGSSRQCCGLAQVAPLYERAPPLLYGGTERVVGCLTDELVRRGHQLTLFASGDSKRVGVRTPRTQESMMANQENRASGPPPPGMSTIRHRGMRTITQQSARGLVPQAGRRQRETSRHAWPGEVIALAGEVGQQVDKLMAAQKNRAA